MATNPSEQVEIYDSSGKVIGQFAPSSPIPKVVVPFSEEEIRQAETETEEFTLAEIIADLEKQ